MCDLMQDIRRAAPLRIVLKGLAGAGIAVLLATSVAAPAAAQSIDHADQAQSDTTFAAPPDAPPRSIIQRYTPTGPRAPHDMTLLVDAPPAPGSAVAQAAPVVAVTEPIGDRVNGPAINTLAAGRSAITVSAGGANRQ